jgi:hypothetical protein
MAAKKTAAGPVRVRIFGKKNATIKELIQQKLGLYFPLEQLSPEDLAKLETFLAEVKLEPIALAHSKATDD